MPLTVDITGSPVNLADKLTDMESVHYSVMATMTGVCGIPVVDDVTFEKFMKRVRFYERLHGNLIMVFEDGADQPTSQPLDADVVKRLLPFRTNWSALTKTAFVNNLIREFQLT